MRTFIYIPGFRNNTKQSRKFTELQNAYPNDKVIQFDWKASDKNIREDFENFLIDTMNRKDDFVFIGSSTGCNILLDVLNFCTRKFYPRPHIIMLNPLFDYSMIENQNIPGFEQNLINQLKRIDIPQLEDNLIIFAKHDHVINHDLISDEDYDYLSERNVIQWHATDHSFSDLDFKWIKMEIDQYIKN